MQMTIDDLDQALADVRYVRSLVSETPIQGAKAAPYFLLWGTVWVLAALLTLLGRGLAPGLIWIGVVALGAASSTAIGIRHRRPGHRIPYLLQLWFWALLVLLCLAVALIPATHPVLADTKASIASWAELMGAWSMFGGSFWLGPRWRLAVRSSLSACSSTRGGDP
jgi:hypothetical protein